MKKIGYVLLTLLFLSVGLVSATTIGREVTTPKYPVHWMPLRFDGTYKTCMMGIILRNWNGDLVCTRQRHARIVPVVVPVVIDTNISIGDILTNVTINDTTNVTINDTGIVNATINDTTNVTINDTGIVNVTINDTSSINDTVSNDTTTNVTA